MLLSLQFGRRFWKQHEVVDNEAENEGEDEVENEEARYPVCNVFVQEEAEQDDDEGGGGDT